MALLRLRCASLLCVHQPGESAAGARSLPAEGTGRSRLLWERDRSGSRGSCYGERLLLAGLGGALGTAGTNVALPPAGQTGARLRIDGENPSIDGRVLLFARSRSRWQPGRRSESFRAARLAATGLPAVARGIRGLALGRGWKEREPALGSGGRGGFVVGGAVDYIGLLIRALWRLRAIRSGIQAGVLTLRTALPTQYEKVGQRRRSIGEYSPACARCRVQSAGFTSFLPIVMRGGSLGGG